MARLYSTPHSLSEARDYLDGRDRKRLGHNTTVEKLIDGKIAVRYHDTHIVQYHTEELVSYYTGGWQTYTTKDRINQLLPPGWLLYQQNHEWFIQHGERVFQFDEGFTINLKENEPVGATESKESKHKILRKRIKTYIDGYMRALSNGQLEAPGGQDCWFCFMFDTGSNTSQDHIDTHIDENYYVPSLVRNAVKAYPVSTFAMIYLNQSWSDSDKVNFGQIGSIVEKQIRSSLNKYICKAFGIPA